MAYSKYDLERSDTVYMLMTDRFCDGDPSNNGVQGAEYQPGNLHFYQGGDWAGLRQQLPYIRSLGFTAVWMSAPQDNELYSRTGDEAGYHGYYTRDFNSPNPHFGTEAELQALVEEAERLGIKIIIDAQLNHTADYLEYPSQQYDPPSYRPAPPFDNPAWYHNNPNIVNFADPFEAQNYSLGGLDDLAQKNSDCWQALMEAYWSPEKNCGWFSYGFSGSRVDAVVEISPEYLSRYEQHTGKHCFGEAYTGSVSENAAFQRYLWGMLDYPLYFQLNNCFCRGEDWGGVKWVLDQDALYPNPNQLFTFIDNHDRARFLSNCGDNVSKLHLALAFLYAVRGIPVVYYGTEQHLAGDFRYTEQMVNDLNREMMPDFSESGTTFKLLQRLNRIRRDYPNILAHGTQEELYFRPGDRVYAFKRAAGGRCMICLFNASPREQHRSIPLGGCFSGYFTDLLDTRRRYRINGASLEITIPPYGAVLLVSGHVSDHEPPAPRKTRIIVHYDTGFGNALYIRGNTLPLSWDFGQRCDNLDAGTWVFELERPKSGTIFFKLLLNDCIWEQDENHRIESGSVLDYWPKF